MPVLSDYLGNLYNKTEILQYLIELKTKSSSKEQNSTIVSVNSKGKDFSHLKSLKDLVELSFADSSGKDNTNDNEAVNADANTNTNSGDTESSNKLSSSSSFCLKSHITNDELGSDASLRKGLKFFYFAECGCLLSSEVITNRFLKLDKKANKSNQKINSLTESGKEQKDNDTAVRQKAESEGTTMTACPNCNTVVLLSNIIYLYPESHSSQLELQKKRFKSLLDAGLSHSLKPIKSKSKNKSKNGKHKTTSKDEGDYEVKEKKKHSSKKRVRVDEAEAGAEGQTHKEEVNIKSQKVA